MSLRAGKLDRRVTIKRLTDGQDEIGQPVQVWVDVVTVWANIKTNTGLQTIRADKESSAVPASIRIRRRAGITAAMRAYEGATVYDIKAVQDDTESRERIDLVCEVLSG
ncbi:phage head closure protein [Variovorax boronicumulans]|uniref:phage head closure protein n=1 Tax=Variovorax boronicumulans TaxID=436515 RepID=UPI001C55F9D9